MTWRRRVNGVLAALLTIALIAGCDSAVPSATLGSSAVASSSAPAPTGRRRRAPRHRQRSRCPPARWSDCGKGFLCADIRVPRDYDDPSVGYLDVALVRLSATEPEDRIGSLIVNPGGPGGSGVEFVRTPAKRASARRPFASASTSSASTRAA